jgi:hypothetical protein
MSKRRPIPSAEPGFEIETIREPNRERGAIGPTLRIHYVLYLDSLAVDQDSGLTRLYRSAVLGGRSAYGW